MKKFLLRTLILCQIINIIYPVKVSVAEINSSNYSIINESVLDTELVFEVIANNKTMYATTNVNVRTLPSKDSKRIGALQYGQAIEKLGDCNNGWSQVNYNGEIAYINSSYLQEAVPEAKEVVSTYNGIIQREGNIPDSRLRNIEAYYVMIPQNVRTHLETSGWVYICSDNNFGARYGYTQKILALAIYDEEKNEKIIYIDNRQKAERSIVHEVGYVIDWLTGCSSGQNDFINILSL